MKFRGLLLGSALSALVFATGCDKAKSALTEALGIDKIEEDRINELLASAGWDPAKPEFEHFNVLTTGIKLAENFKMDINQSVEIDLPFELPSQAEGAAKKQRSLILMRAEPITMDDASYTRFRIITVARYEDNKLKIDGSVVNQYMDESQIVSLENKNQAGEYLFVEAKGEKGITFLGGSITLKKDGATETVPVPGATIFTSGSPFVTVSGSAGKYLLAMLEGSKGTNIAYHKTIAKDLDATGTPTQASKEIAYAGLLDEYKGAVNEKVGTLGSATATTKAMETFDMVNGAVTDFFDAWKITQSDLMFIQPKQAAPAGYTPPEDVAPAPTEPPAAEPAPAPEAPFVRRDVDTPEYLNVDLGCTAFHDGAPIDMVREGAKLDDYENAKGWRAIGDVRYAFDYADVLFAVPEASRSRYLGEVGAYCLLTTGNQMNKATNDAAYLPGPAGAGQVSEMWQKVQIPASAASVQVRVAFFTTEFPAFVGTPFNDSFFVKFDESPDFIAQGNLNDLAGASDAALAEQVAACKNLAAGSGAADTTKTCGEWKFVAAEEGLNGELWDIGRSDTAPAHGTKFGCLKGENPGTKCYHGMIKPRIICKDIAEQDKGKVRTLRFNVSDVGDAFFDSALAVDSVVFSNKTCDNPEGRMTEEPTSRASML